MLEAIADQSTRYKDEGHDVKYPGAYKTGTEVLALMRDNVEWKLAEIYDIREAKFFKEEVNESDFEEKLANDDLPVQQHATIGTAQENTNTYVRKYLKEFQEQISQRMEAMQLQEEHRINDPGRQFAKSSEQELLDSMRYEYYIHYLGIDRRNDRWVTEQFLKVDKEEISNQKAKINAEVEKEKASDQMQREQRYFFNDENHGMSEKEVQEFINQTKFKTVESIQFGKYWLETWYFTPLPKEFHTKCLYICDFCFFFCVHKQELLRHSRKCTVRHPPGDEIYRDNDVAFFEVDGTL